MSSSMSGHTPPGDDNTMVSSNPFDATMPSVPGRHGPQLARGDHLGRYEIEGMVGEGGMGAVYAARDLQLDRRVALKVLHPYAHDPHAAERMVREAKALAQLDHPNVVAIYDAGEIDGRVFLAMRLISGRTLQQVLDARELTWPEALALFGAAGWGLAAAHDKGLVHRDFKASNVLVDDDGRVAVTDFGLARPAAPVEPDRRPLRELTVIGTLVGTPAYMAPELHSLRPATAASDQFAFCVALWEALFGRHPYLMVTPDMTPTPLAYAYAVTIEPIGAPPIERGVPRRIVAALRRGLDRDPTKRWPSMQALLWALAPRRRSRGPLLAGVVAVVAAGTAVALGAAGVFDRGGGPSCASRARTRVEAVWSPAHAGALRAAFAKTDRPWRETVATRAIAGLDAYASRWQALDTDTCAIGGRDDAAAAQLAAARVRCLDRRLATLRATVGVLTEIRAAGFVDQAAAIVDGLPSLADCEDAGAVIATTAPPADKAGEITSLEARLADARATHHAGDLATADAALAALRADADKIEWAPLQVSILQALGETRAALLQPALPTFVDAAELATRSGLDREAVRAWSGATVAAGLARSREAVDGMAAIARAIAGRVGDARLDVEARIAHGRALVRLRKWTEAEKACREALAAADAAFEASAPTVERALACAVEALVPMDKDSELAGLIDRAIAIKTKELGADHPAIADYLGVRVGLLVREQKIDDAVKLAEDVLARRTRAFGNSHVKVAESLKQLAGLAAQRGDLKTAKQHAEQALAIADAFTPSPRSMRAFLHRDLGMYAQQAGDWKAVRDHFDQAVTITEQDAGADSLDMALLLIMNGQYRTKWDFDGGVADLRRSVMILEKLGDRRVAISRGALALMLIDKERWAEARPVLEDAIRDLDVENTDPFNRGHLRWLLARTIVETGGDKKRARGLAAEAREDFVKIKKKETVEEIDRWLKKNRR